MGSVASNLTNITAAEVADDASWEDIGSGPGNANSGAIFIQGSEAQARRVDNQEKGFSFDNVTGIDLSAADTLVGWWVLVLQPPLLGLTTNQDLEVRVGDNNSTTTSWDGWNVLEAANYPSVGGWVRVWVAINEITPDNGAGTPSYSALRQFGINGHVGDVAGTALNMVCDAIDYLDGGGAALELTGTSSVFDDFLSADEGTVGNKYGVWESRSGILFCKVRSQIGTATSVVFDDSAFVIVFPLQEGTGGVDLVNADSNGLTIDLQHASTTVDMADGVIRSESSTTTQGDLIVSGTSGTFDALRVTFDGMRTIELNVACTLTDCFINNSGIVDAGAGADLAGTSIANSTVATDTAALVWDVNLDPNGELDNMSFVKGAGTTHAIELGITSPLTVTLTGHSYSGYNASNAQNDSTILVSRTTGTVTINLAGGGDTPSYKTAGAIVIIQTLVPVAVTVKDAADSSNIQNARVYVEAAAGGDLPSDVTVTITRVAIVAAVAHTAHGMVTGQTVAIRGADQQEYNGIQTIVVTNPNLYTYAVSGSPTTPATGTIKSTAVILNGLSSAGGVVQDTAFSYTSDQPIVGRVRRGSTSPLYKTSVISGTIALSGFSVTTFLVADE